MNAAEVKSAVFASVGCLVGMLAVHEANKFAYEKYEYKVGCPPSGPLACLLFCMPTAPASQPKTVIISHAIAVLSALCAVAVHDFIPVLDVPKPVVGLVLSILAMKLAKAINPPAAAYAAALSGSGTTFGAVLTCVEIKILRRVQSSRRPPRHRRDACSMAWRCRFLTARPSQDGRVIAEK